jgi:hypothetical protein
MQVSQQWRNLENRMKFGFEHDFQRDMQLDDLGIFCPTYSQPEINLPDNWENNKDQ